MKNFLFENYRQSQWAVYYLRFYKKHNIVLSPEPSDLPMPPKHWLNTTKCCNSFELTLHNKAPI